MEDFKKGEIVEYSGINHSVWHKGEYVRFDPESEKVRAYHIIRPQLKSGAFSSAERQVFGDIRKVKK